MDQGKAAERRSQDQEQRHRQGAVPSSGKAALLYARRGRHPGCPEGLQGEAGEDSSQLGYWVSQVLADKDIPIVILST